MKLRLPLLAVAAVLALAAPAQARTDPRYGLVHGCYALRADSGRFLAKQAGGYAATATSPGAAERFRMQATALGRYMLYGTARDVMVAGGSGVRSGGAPGPAADWTVDDAPGARFTVAQGGRGVSVAPDGAVTLGAPSALAFVKAEGCPTYPESEVDATGRPSTSPPFGEVSGLVDAHMHMMAYEFLGGRVHCGKPWSPYGVTVALRDCPDHYPAGQSILETALGGGLTHDPVGWPTFRYWPNPHSLTHEDSYYKWLERSWRAGQRVFVNLFVNNNVLCDVYPLKQNSCNDMDSVRLQAKDIYALQDYIDAQSGGPGKGFFRIVKDPFTARRVIASGKLAVILGIEVSEPFNCRVYNDVPQCSAEDIDRGLDEVYKLGVRDMELVNKFDNALAGVAGDSGTAATAINLANRYETGKFWQMQACTGPADESDRPQLGLYDHDHHDLLSAIAEKFLPLGVAPIYPKGANCNARGLTTLGEHLIRRMMDKGMIVDPDHLSVLARKQVMSLLEARRYSGVVSSHSWSSPDVVPRIYKLGGMVTPYAGGSTSFIQAWKITKIQRDRRFYFGFGWGADMNGFGAQGAARHPTTNPVTYPFKSWDGKVTLGKLRTGDRTWDINTDGVANYGLYPDWVQDLRKQAGEQIVRDLGRGAEAYLQMWERAEGVPHRGCQPARAIFDSRGLYHKRVGEGYLELLYSAGQPVRREGRRWSWCVRLNPGARVVTVLTPQGKVGLVGTNAPSHTFSGIHPGYGAWRLHGHRTRRLGRNTLVFDVRRGRIHSIALVSRSIATHPRQLRDYLRRARL